MYDGYLLIGKDPIDTNEVKIVTITVEDEDEDDEDEDVVAVCSNF